MDGMSVFGGRAYSDGTHIVYEMNDGKNLCSYIMYGSMMHPEGFAACDELRGLHQSQGLMIGPERAGFRARLVNGPTDDGSSGMSTDWEVDWKLMEARKKKRAVRWPMMN
jgi:hypothetical protein